VSLDERDEIGNEAGHGRVERLFARSHERTLSPSLNLASRARACP
jgi:hypothetical protein